MIEYAPERSPLNDLLTSTSTFSDVLRDLESQGYPHPNFNAAINLALVASHARPAALPSGNCDPILLGTIIPFFNNRVVRYSSHVLSEICLLEFRHLQDDGEIENLELIIRVGDFHSFDTTAPWTDKQLGLHLGIYHLNAENFRRGLPYGLVIREECTGIDIFTEAFATSYMTTEKLAAFLSHCNKTCGTWDRAMKRLGLRYCFKWSIF